MILLISPPRTGGITLCTELSIANPTYENMWECFSKVSKQQQQENFTKCTTQHNTIVKTNPMQISKTKNGIDNMLEELCKHSGSIYYTVRESVYDQTKSLHNAQLTKEFGPQESVMDARTHRGYNIHIDQEMFTKTFKRLVKGWIEVDRLYTLYPGTVVRLESRDKPYKYNKEYTMLGEWPDVSELQAEFEAWKLTSKLFHS